MSDPSPQVENLATSQAETTSDQRPDSVTYADMVNSQKEKSQDLKVTDH